MNQQLQPQQVQAQQVTPAIVQAMSFTSVLVGIMFFVFIAGMVRDLLKGEEVKLP